jgi:hypothetical protein
MQCGMIFISRCLVACLLGCAIVLAGCRKQEGGSADATGDTSITGKPSDPPVTIKPEWKPDVTYMMRMESEQTWQLPAFGGGRGNQRQTNNAPMETAFAQEYSLKVTNAGDGQRGLEMEVIGIELQAGRGAETWVNFDSQNRAAPREPNPTVEALEKLVGGKLRFLVGPDSRVLSVEGTREFFQRMDAPADSGGRATRQRGGGMFAGALLSRMYSEDVFKQMVEVAGAPPGAMKIGESWPVTREAAAPVIGKLVVTTTNTLRGWQNHAGVKCARVEFTGVIAMNSAATTNAGFRMEIQDGMVSGHYWFDPELGFSRETVMDQAYKVSVPASGGRGTNNPARTNAPGGFSSPVKQRVTVKLMEARRGA